MKGAVVYDKERLATVSKNMSNRWMGETLCRLLGFELRDVTEDLSEYGVAVFRTEDYAGRKRLEERGGRAFNNAQTGMIGNDKKLAYEFTAKLGIASCEWTSVSDEAEYPCIVKSRFGHGGKEVFWANDRREAEEILKEIGAENAIFQRPAKTLGKDVRLYMLGGELIFCVERLNPHSFKSNFSLGGRARLIECPPTALDQAKQICNELKCDFVGIDFIFDGDTPIFNEIEDVVGTRMLYSNGIDAAEIYANYIRGRL